MSFFADIRRTWNAALISAEIEDASRAFFADPKNAPFRDDIAWNKVWQQYLVLVLAKAEESGQKVRSLEAMEIARDMMLYGISNHSQSIDSGSWKDAVTAFLRMPENRALVDNNVLFESWQAEIGNVMDHAEEFFGIVLTHSQTLKSALIRAQQLQAQKETQPHGEQSMLDEVWNQATQQFFEDSSNQVIRSDPVLMREWEDEMQAIVDSGDQRRRGLSYIQLMYAARQNLIARDRIDLTKPELSDENAAYRQAEEVFFADPANAPILNSDALYGVWRGQFKAVAFDAFSRDEKLTDLQMMRAARKVLVERGLLISAD